MGIREKLIQRREALRHMQKGYDLVGTYSIADKIQERIDELGRVLKLLEEKPENEENTVR